MATPLSVLKHKVSAVDPDASAVDAWTITGAVWVSIGATCAVASGSLTFRLVFTDLEDNVTGVSPSYTMTSSSQISDFGNSWLGTPQPDSPLPSLSVCADRMRLKVDAITGAWTVAIQAFLPPPG
jgi:hypothetical protein